MTIEALLQKSAQVGATSSLSKAVDLAFELQEDLAQGVSQFVELRPFNRVASRENDPRIQQVAGNNAAHVEVLYEFRFGQRYSTELTFTLQHEKVCCLVQTFFHPEGNRPYQPSATIALQGQLDQVVYGQSYAELVVHAITQAVEHRMELITQELGVKLLNSTRDCLREARYVSSLTV